MPIHLSFENESKAMKPRDLFLSAIEGRSPGRTPVGSPTSVATVEQMEAMGARFPEAHQDGPKMARLAAGAYEILGYDAIMPVFSVTQEAAAMGCEMDWGAEDQMPTARTHPFPDPSSVRIPQDLLTRPSIAAVLEAIRMLKREYGSEVAIIGKVMGPWTLSYHLHGLQEFLTETITAPEAVHGFLHALKEVTLCFGQAQLEAGADLLCLADHATGDLVSAECYRDFLLPVHQEIAGKLTCPIILHICGDTTNRLEYIAQTGFSAFHFDSKVKANIARGIVGKRIALVGNINNPETLLSGSEEAVRVEAGNALRHGVDVLAPECAVPLRTPVRNLKILSELVRQERREGEQ
jgi:[methyl-Co(III) methanol-specific corrinoid protein]:coenzyme M methyltransferase